MNGDSRPAHRSFAGPTHWVFTMLHQSVLRSANGMDQHVSFKIWCICDFWYLHAARMSLQSALIGFLLSKLLPTPLTAQELIVVQTTAVATGTVRFKRHWWSSVWLTHGFQMPLAAGFVGILPALSLLSEERDGTPPINLSWIAAIGWSCSVAFFG